MGEESQSGELKSDLDKLEIFLVDIDGADTDDGTIDSSEEVEVLRRIKFPLSLKFFTSDRCGWKKIAPK